jgi:hypothetical protein
MKKAGLASVVISLTACGGGGQTSGAGTTSTAAPENVQAGASCERIVDAVMRWTASQEEMSVAELEARRPDLRASGVARCSDHADEQPFACIGAALDDERAIDACLRQGLAAYGEGYKSEAEVQLTRLGKALKATFIETGGYEVGAVA